MVSELPVNITYTTAHLYDSAITCDIPNNFIDVSDLRDVPSHQCVYSDSDIDSSIIIELNQTVINDVDSTNNIATYHMQQYINEQNVSSTECIKQGTLNNSVVPNINNINYITYNESIIHVSKYREQDIYNKIHAYMYVITLLSNIQTDICIILNAPLQFSESSVVSSKTIIHSQQYYDNIIQRILQTIRINNYSLFG